MVYAGWAPRDFASRVSTGDSYRLIELDPVRVTGKP